MYAASVYQAIITRQAECYSSGRNKQPETDLTLTNLVSGQPTEGPLRCFFSHEDSGSPSGKIEVVGPNEF